MSDIKDRRVGSTGAPAPPAASPAAEEVSATPAGAAPAGTAPEIEAPPAPPSTPAIVPGRRPAAPEPQAPKETHAPAQEPSARAIRYREHRIPRRHRVFVNRNLRMTQTRAIGFDLDHTLA